MIEALVNDLIVTIKEVYQDKIGNIFVAPQYDPTEFATIQAEVHSVPRYVVQDRPDYKGYSVKDVQAGDRIIMRYDVTSMYAAQPKDEAPRYKHHFMYKGQNYWRADIIKCFAVIRGLDIIMLNGYVMLEVPPPPPKIFLPGHFKRLQRTIAATVWHIGNPLTNREHIGAKVGDVVHFNPRVMQVYQINDKPFAIIKQSHVCGVEHRSNKNRLLSLCD